MLNRPIRCLAVGLLSVSLTCGAIAQDGQRGELGRSEKLRILVDKVMQPQEGWVTKEWMVRETAEAGFNVFSPRRGHDNLEEVRQVTSWCEKHGIFHIPWMRGTLAAASGPAADGKRVLWAGGREQPLWSVCSDEFWEWTTRYIVEYARISAQTDRLIGVFLDYENYSPGGSGNLYEVTYEDAIWGPFLEAKGLDRPRLEPGGRQSWLKQQGFHEAFVEFQVNHWRRRCRKLREAVDEYDPQFQFCIYPAPGTPFMVRACYPEWSTVDGPIILADPWVYGRPSRFMPQGEALAANRQTLLKGMQIPKEAGIPFIYSGGIDPVVRGADPEFCGKNAVMISELTAGYWVFYEGPHYKKDHAEYFRWFKWANDQIDAGRLQAWQEAREAPEKWILDVFKETDGKIQLAPRQDTGKEATFGKVTLRKDNLMLVAAKRGQPVKIVLRNVPVAAYASMLVWDVRNSDLERVAAGTIPHKETGIVGFTPDEDGIYLLGASAGSCAYTVLAANVPVGLLTNDGASFIYAADRLYFHVPDTVKEFSVTARGWGAETVRVHVLDMAGKQVADGQTNLGNATVEITVPVGAGAGQTWSLTTARAVEGVVEDYSLRLSANLPQVLSLVPEHVFLLK